MTPPTVHSGDALQRLLDGRLPPAEQAAVERHLGTCERCRRECDALRTLKAATREGLSDAAVPAALAARVAAALASAGAGAPLARPSARRAWRRVGAGLGLAAAAVLVVLLLRPGRPDHVGAVTADFSRYRAADLALDRETGDPQALEAFFARAGLPFPTRVFDLGMMGYRLRGGGVRRIAGRPSAVFVYEASDGRLVLCQMYEGRVSELPAAAAERAREGMRFRIYRRGDLTLVFWQEGALVCVLVSDGDPEEAVQLAIAKAVKVSGRG